MNDGADWSLKAQSSEELPDSLEELRRLIDNLDNDIHSRLLKRAAIAHRVAAIKARTAVDAGRGQGSAVRMAREAIIMRRLAARHDGALPLTVVFHLWRTLFAANIILESGFAVGVYGGTQPEARWEMACRMYGGAVSPVRYNSAVELMDALHEDNTLMGLFPMPGSRGGEDDWWCRLADAGEDGLRVIARLPFLARGGEDDRQTLLAVARAPYEPSGDDTTLIRITASELPSPVDIGAALESHGLTGRLMAGAAMPDGDSAGLLAVDGFAARDDKRLAALGSQWGSVVCLGGFPNPVVVP